MTRPRQRILSRAFTMIDLMIVVVILGILFFFLLPSTTGKPARATRINCVSNLKQVGTAMRMFGNDCGSGYPPFGMTNEAWNYYQMVGEQLSSPRVLLCPADKDRFSRKAPTDFDAKDLTAAFQHPSNRNNSLSYFYGVDATDTAPGMILSGDRNITTNTAMLAGLLSLNTNAL